MPVPVKLIARRTAVATAVVGSVAAGAVTIRAAGDWAASNAPAAAPVSADAVTQQLAAEKARSDDLQARLQNVTAQTTDLAVALEAATAKIGTDGKAAQALQKELKAAQKKLADLKAKMAHSQASGSGPAVYVSTPRHTARVVTVTRHVTRKPAAAATPAPTHSTTGASGASGGGDDDGGGGDD